MIKALFLFELFKNLIEFISFVTFGFIDNIDSANPNYF